MSAGTNRIITPLIVASFLLMSIPTFAGKTIYVDAKRHFRFQYPKTWTLTTGYNPSMHYHDSFVSLNNFGKENFWLFTEWARGQKPKPLSSKLPPGSVYLDIGWNDFSPGYVDDYESKIVGEMTAQNLAGVLEKSSEELKENGEVHFRYITFSKWRRRWLIYIYLREPVSEANRKMLNRVLKSFRFDAFPVGDELWGAALAREHLWPEEDPNLFPLIGSKGYRKVHTEKTGDEVIVTFTVVNRQREPEKLWQFRVTPTGKVIPVSEKPPVTFQRSEWGKEVSGLQCRVTAPTEIEQGMPLKVTIKLRSIPENLDPDVRYLNPFLFEEFLTLSLKNVETQKIFTVRPYSFGGGRPVDRGRGRIPLDGSNFHPWEVTFPLVRVRDTLKPGLYQCTVEYSFPKEQTQWWDKSEDWENFGFWHGIVVSGPFKLKILEEMPKTWQFLLPKQLHLAKDGKVYFRIENAFNIKLPVKNGFFVGTYIYNSVNERRGLYSGTPATHNISAVTQFDNKAKDKNLSFTIEVFETSDPPLRTYHPGLGYGAYDPYVYAGFTQFLWHPVPGCGYYKILWKKSFDFDFDENTESKMRGVETDENRDLWLLAKACLP